MRQVLVRLIFVVAGDHMPPVTESEDLLALGAQLEAKLQTYRAASERLTEARSVAANVWPKIPEGTLVIASSRNIGKRPGVYHGCYVEETDFEGNRWPKIISGTAAARHSLDMLRSLARFACTNDGNREIVDILNAVLTDDLSAGEAACAEALSHGVHSADVVLNILARRHAPARPANIMTPAALTLGHAPIADCARYDNLRRTI